MNIVKCSLSCLNIQLNLTKPPPSLSFSLSIYIYLYLSIHLSIYLYKYLSIYLPNYLYIFFLSIYLIISRSLCSFFVYSLSLSLLILMLAAWQYYKSVHCILLTTSINLLSTPVDNKYIWAGNFYSSRLHWSWKLVFQDDIENNIH